MAPIEAAFRVASTDAAYTQAEAPIDLDALNLFLKDSRAAALDSNSAPVTLVMGNEAADLDSIVSAITYALHVTRRSCIDYEWMDRDPPDPVTGAPNGWNNEKESQCELRFAVPYVAVPRADLPLRGDAAWLLDDIGVDVDSIVFADDFDPLALDASGRLRDVVLVDHNVPEVSYKDFINKNRAGSNAAQAKSREKSLEKLLASDDVVERPPTSGKALKFRFPDPPRCGNDVLAVNEVTHGYGDVTLFDDVSFELGRRDRVAILGAMPPEIAKIGRASCRERV